MNSKFFLYHPIHKKWEQHNSLDKSHIVCCFGDMVFCPIHNCFERIIQYDGDVRTNTCTITASCFALLKREGYHNNCETLEEIFAQQWKMIYAYEIIEKNYLSIKFYYVNFSNNKIELSEETKPFFNKDYKYDNVDKMHYISKRIKHDRRKKSYLQSSPFLHNHITNTDRSIKNESIINSDIYDNSICDEIIDYIIMREIITQNAHHYSFGSNLIHGKKRYEIWKKYSDINFSLIHNKLNLRNRYDFSNTSNYENFSILMNEFNVEKTGQYYQIFKENPLELLKIIILQRIGFGYLDCMFILQKTKNFNFLNEFDYKICFCPYEQFGLRLSSNNLFPEFLNWLCENNYKEFARNICIAQTRNMYSDTSRYILWKVLKITGHLPKLEPDLSPRKFIERAYIGFDAIAHVFALDFVLEKRYKDGKAGEYSYMELLTFQDVLKIVKITEDYPSYSRFISCILNNDRYVSISKNGKIVALMFASKNGIKLKELEKIPESSLEGWKQANCYYEDKDHYIHIPEIRYKR